jgi:hypothetical protein
MNVEKKYIKGNNRNNIKFIFIILNHTPNKRNDALTPIEFGIVDENNKNIENSTKNFIFRKKNIIIQFLAKEINYNNSFAES